MGQGTLTGLAQMVADELDADGLKYYRATDTRAKCCAGSRLGHFFPPVEAKEFGRANNMYGKVVQRLVLS
ncbi:MAG: hypothetical protein CM1200mP24_08960 [Gammaproteobacteria bacterium]|nr:MAG: hypothetical protein CM1200mP24_08960 [Gammaproteobacteria bacterium]